MFFVLRVTEVKCSWSYFNWNTPHLKLYLTVNIKWGRNKDTELIETHLNMSSLTLQSALQKEKILFLGCHHLCGVGIACGPYPSPSIIHWGFYYAAQTDSQLLSLTNRAEEWGNCSSLSHTQQPLSHLRNWQLLTSLGIPWELCWMMTHILVR